MYNRRLIISEEEKKYILNLHEDKRKREFGLMIEGYDSTTNTYTTESQIIMTGDYHTNGQTIKGSYNITFPKGSKVSFSTVTGGATSKGPYTNKSITLAGGNMSKPRQNTVNVTLDCTQTSFLYHDDRSDKNVTLTSNPSGFVNKMKTYFCNTDKKNNKKIIGGGGGETPTIDQVKDCNNRLSFRVGMKGEPIKKLQGLLGSKYAEILGVQNNQYDGNFGPKTKKAVIQFQTDNALTPDGVVGCKTLGKMLEIFRSSVKSTETPNKPVNPNSTLGDESGLVSF